MPTAALHSALARLVAALLALGLSGVAQAIPARPLGPHRCSCRSHGERHVCACPICNAAARRATAARRAAAARAAPSSVDHAQDDLPPCHRRPADAAAAAAPAAPPADAPEDGRPPPGGCALQPRCGDGPAGLAAPRALDPAVLVAAPSSPRGDRGEPLTPLGGRAVAIAARPELPPPRLPAR